MNFIVENNERVKHHIVVGDSDKIELKLVIVRLAINGGIPQKLIISMEYSASYLEVMKKVQHLVNLEHGIFTMLCENSIEQSNNDCSMSVNDEEVM
jgi:hypothetical protein